MLAPVAGTEPWWLQPYQMPGFSAVLAHILSFLPCVSVCSFPLLSSISPLPDSHQLPTPAHCSTILNVFIWFRSDVCDEISCRGKSIVTCTVLWWTWRGWCIFWNASLAWCAQMEVSLEWLNVNTVVATSSLIQWINTRKWEFLALFLTHSSNKICC